MNVDERYERISETCRRDIREEERNFKKFAALISKIRERKSELFAQLLEGTQTVQNKNQTQDDKKREGEQKGILHYIEVQIKHEERILKWASKIVAAATYSIVDTENTLFDWEYNIPRNASEEELAHIVLNGRHTSYHSKTIQPEESIEYFDSLMRINKMIRTLIEEKQHYLEGERKYIRGWREGGFIKTIYHSLFRAWTIQKFRTGFEQLHQHCKDEAESQETHLADFLNLLKDAQKKKEPLIRILNHPINQKGYIINPSNRKQVDAKKLFYSFYNPQDPNKGMSPEAVEIPLKQAYNVSQWALGVIEGGHRANAGTHSEKTGSEVAAELKVVGRKRWAEKREAYKKEFGSYPPSQRVYSVSGSSKGRSPRKRRASNTDLVGECLRLGSITVGAYNALNAKNPTDRATGAMAALMSI